jgi:hypothetical protein
MKTHTGLWIDHRRAVIVLPSEENPRVILSNAERHGGRIDGEQSTESFESLLVPADDVQDRKFAKSLKTYYDEIIACVHDAKSLLIFGPGEAKGEFKKRLEHEKPSSRTVSMVTSDKMTDRQITAKVHDHFKSEFPLSA